MPRPINTLLAALVTAVAIAAVLVPGALAKNGDTVRVAGKCTSAATAKLKLGADDRGIEVEFEVDQNRNGVPWRVTLRRNGALVAAATLRTHAPSGSFSFQARRLQHAGRIGSSPSRRARAAPPVMPLHRSAAEPLTGAPPMAALPGQRRLSSTSVSRA